MGLKLNGKMKRRIRKAVAGVCLVSSVLVAAVPSDYSGVAQADESTASTAVVDDTDPLDYDKDSLKDRNGALLPDDNVAFINYALDELKEHDIDKTYNAYGIISTSSGWELSWKYVYFNSVSNQTTGVGDSKGVIINYNTAMSTAKLEITDTVIAGYEVVSSNAFNTAIREVLPEKTWTLQGNPSASLYEEEIKVYFPTYYDNWVELYNAEISKGNAGNPNQVYMTVSGDLLTDRNLQYIWYCDYCTDYTGQKYTLQEVNINLNVRGAEYKASTTANDFREMPTDDAAYVIRYRDWDDDTPGQDGNGFVYAATARIDAIGKRAFANAATITDMTLLGEIAYIGDEAFIGSTSIVTVSFEGNVSYVGNRAFMGCSNLTDVKLNDNIQRIGKETFSSCPKISEIHIPNNISTIGFGAFANCNGLHSVDMSGSLQYYVTIGEYAFYNCEALSEITFRDSNDTERVVYYAFGKAAFAVAEGASQTGNLKSFSFPMIFSYKSAVDSSWDGYKFLDENQDPYTSALGDYLFAGRGGLEELVMPKYFGTSSTARVPMNTLKNCIGLKKLVFDDSSINATYDSILFRDVKDTELCVYGPGYADEITKTPAEPRKATWQAKPGSGLGYVPYVYKIGDTEHYEVGVDEYRWTLQINSDGKTATIIGCQFTSDTVSADTAIDLLIPGKVAAYTVTSLGDGCFANNLGETYHVKDYVESITIMDDSIQVIGKEAFKALPKLTWVDIGNSVVTISANAFSDNSQLKEVVIGGGIETVEEEAFANCPKLTDVIWETPSSYNTQVEIADSAFVTGGTMLYFEGNIELGYGPFDYAMEDDTVSGGQSHYINAGTRICYRSPGPLSYYVIRDEEADENLLIDYPHYSDLDDDVRARYERRSNVLEDGTVSGNLSPTPQDIQLVNETRQLKIPEAVTSIDVKSFYLSTNVNNTNQGSWIYIEALKNPNASEGLNISCEDLYSNDDLTISGDSLQDTYKDSGGYHSGLFSGYYVDRTPLSANGIAEAATKGNDWIISIEMPGVTSIPDYAFDSCENLQSIILSDACEEIAPTAFQNCNALRTIAVDGNYTYDNYILYKLLSDGTYQITTCLPGRGVIDRDAKSLWVNSSNDPNLTMVSELEAGAFEGCTEIIGVDLSDTSITRIPQNTFQNCSSLTTVVFPDTADLEIGDYVFGGQGSYLSVTIPDTYRIADTAFDPDHTVTTIYTRPDCRFITRTYLRTDADGNTVNAIENIYVSFIGSEYTVEFRNDDYSIYETRTVESGKSTYPPNVPPTPLTAENSGYVFDSWVYYYTDFTPYDGTGDPLQNVQTNLLAMPVFVPDPEAETFTITFRNDDYSVFETKTVAAGNNGLVPSTYPTPQLTEHQGWYFSHWNFYDSVLGLENVTENRNAIAVFSEIPVSGGDLSGSGDSSNGSGSGDSSSNGSGSGSNGSGSGDSSSNGSGSGSSTSGNSVSDNYGRYNVVVENGAGGGYYAPGSVVTITAYAAPSGKVFDRWTTSNTDIGFSNAYGSSTTFIMPTHEVKVTATYKTPSASSNVVSQNGTSTGTSSSSSGSVTRSTDRGGTDVTVTTSAIDNNNKNLASATVSGSTDNFVVKITDSASAYAAVEQALRAQYGDLSNIKFVGFDISLYDETGTRKIEDTSGLAVNITIPIPDDLVAYAGNNMAAGVVNGVLDPMTVKFTTIDGVPCMQFTATHFSPYAIYVNTNNLVSGVTDTTPKTGDIHPKWFLAIGLACISGILFMWKDKKKVAV